MPAVTLEGDLVEVPAGVLALAEAARRAGGRAWIVGGAVRDLLRGEPARDFDVEVHGLAAEALGRLLAGLGRTRRVGRSFPVFRHHPAAGGGAVEVSLPRAADGAAEGDPHAGIEAACRRRDLTVNAIAWDPLTGELADPCGGRADLAAGLLRACDPTTFGADPLRPWRAAVFAARLGFALDPELVALARSLDPSGLPPERVRAEVEKLLLAAEPLAGVRAARAMDLPRRSLPELAPGDGPEVDPAVARAGRLRRETDGDPRRFALVLGAWTHRLDPGAREALLDRLGLHAMGGYPVRRRLVGALRAWPELAVPATDATLRHLADVAELDLATLLAEAIGGGEAPRANRERARDLGVLRRPLPALVGGRDLRRLGVPPGRALGELLAAVRSAQLDGRVRDREQALALARGLWEARRR